MIKPCLPTHPEFVDSCPVCHLWQRPEYRDAHDLIKDGPIPKLSVDDERREGVSYKVAFQGCQQKCRWAWVVILDGVPQGEPTKEVDRVTAVANAQREARELHEFLKSVGRDVKLWI